MEDKLLTEMSIVWTDDDVRCQANNDGIFDLTDKDVSDVLRLLDTEHDANVGITWDTISMWIIEVVADRDALKSERKHNET